MKKSTLLALLILAIILAILDSGGLFKGMRGIFQSITVPIQLGVYRTVSNLRNELTAFTEISSLREKNRALVEENLDLQTKTAVLKKVSEENQVLKEQLGLRKELPKSLKLAQILGFSPLGTQSRLLVDKGEKDDIQIGDIALVRDNLLGRLVSVSQKTSTVVLLTDPESKIPAETTKGAKGLLVGQFGSEMRLTKVLQEEKLSVGDLILSLPDTNLPKNLVLGKIVNVTKNDKEIFQEAKVEYLLSAAKLTEVFITRSE